MQANVICDNCKSDNVIRKGNLKQNNLSVKEEKRVLKIMYFVCFECGKINVVQIDNDETTRIKESLTKTIMKAIERKKKGEKASKKLNAKRIRLSESLENKRKKLIEKYKKEVENILTLEEKGDIL